MVRDSLKLAAYRADKAANEAEWLEGHIVRDEERAERSPKQQLDVLDRRLGKGLGAVRERKRLKLQIAEVKAAKAKAKAEQQASKKKKKEEK